MMRTIQKNLLITVFLLALVFPIGQPFLHAQESFFIEKDGHYWVTLGIGAGSIGIAVGGGFSYQMERKIFSIRYVYQDNFEEFILGSSPSRVADVAILYGLNASKEDARGVLGLASISAGVGLVTSTSQKLLSQNRYKDIKNSTIGLAIESQLIWAPVRAWGLGLYGFANINSERSFVGVLLSLPIGKLK